MLSLGLDYKDFLNNYSQDFEKNDSIAINFVSLII